MSIVTLQSALAFVPQTGNSDSANDRRVAPSVNNKWRWIPYITSGVNPVDLQAGVTNDSYTPGLPADVVKYAHWAGGNVEIEPRVATSHLHWILWSLCGSMAVQQVQVSGVGVSAWDYIYGGGSGITGSYDAAGNFTPDASSGSNDVLKNYYMSILHLLPPNEDNTREGYRFGDARVGGGALVLRAASPLRMTFAAVARRTNRYDDADIRASGVLKDEWNPEYVADGGAGETGAAGLPTGLPLTSCSGSIKMPVGSPLDISANNLTIAFGQSMTTPQEELDVFNYHPNGFQSTGILTGVTVTLRKPIYDMYKNVYFGGAKDWSPKVWEGGEPLSILMTEATPTLNGGTLYVELEYYVKRIKWTLTPARNTAGEIVTANLVGTPVRSTDGSFSWYLRVRNGVDPDKDAAGNAASGYLTNWQPT